MKTISRNLLMAAAVVTILNFNSCKKYEDGPGFSLRSKKWRLTGGEWEVVKATTSNGQSYLGDYDVEVEFDKDGDFTMSFKYSYYGQSYSYEGEWEFSSDKEEIEIDIFEDQTQWEIKRLTNKELWFEDEDGTEWELEAI